MKKKFFLRGLGVGIVITTLVLCICYRNQDSEQSIVEQAKELGMEFPEKTPDTLVKPSATPEETASGSATKATEKASASPTAKATATPTVTPKKAKKSEDGKTYTFTVRSGLLSSSVARELKEAGIIDDDDAFNDYILEKGWGRKVRAGKYKIPVGASYFKIAKIITRQD